MVTLSTDAMDMARKLQQESPALVDQSLRLYLDGKGCDGFFYGVSFDQKSTEDHEFFQGGISLVVDPDTLEFVTGSTINWVDDERGRGFLVDNPNQRKYRGKFYKRQAWQERLQEKLKPLRAN